MQLVSSARPKKALQRLPNDQAAPGVPSVTLQDLGNIGEFVGAVGVVVSLVYLAVQIRQNTKATRANSVQDLTENINKAAEKLIEPENAELYLRGIRSYATLTPEEKLRFGQLINVLVNRLDTSCLSE